MSLHKECIKYTRGSGPSEQSSSPASEGVHGFSLLHRMRLNQTNEPFHTLQPPLLQLHTSKYSTPCSFRISHVPVGCDPGLDPPAVRNANGKSAESLSDAALDELRQCRSQPKLVPFLPPCLYHLHSLCHGQAVMTILLAPPANPEYAIRREEAS